MLRRDSLFGNLGPGYLAIFLITSAYFLLGATIGTYKLSMMLDFATLPYFLAGWALPALIWAAILAVEVTRRRVEYPTRAIFRLASQNRYWLARGAAFSGIAIPVSRSFGALKTAIPHLNPFYADHYLIAADRMIFGTDAWRITHRYLGEIATVTLDRIYVLWFTEILVFLGFLNFSRNKKIQVRGLLSYILTAFVVGNLLAVFLSSVGPCFVDQFYGDKHFLPLMNTLHEYDAEHPLGAMRVMAWLRLKQGTDAFGAGISAMPSLHVSLAYLCFLVTMESTRKLWLRLLTGLFALAILIGSVHLGWHYAVDGLVAIVVVTLIWMGTGRFVDWLERRGDIPPDARPEPAGAVLNPV